MEVSHLRHCLVSIAAVALVASVLTASVVSGEVIYPGYTWQSVGDGIYVHSRNEPLAGPVDGNSTIIVSDEDVFVVDTHINPAVARAVIVKIREITDKPVTHVINTHWHDDHTNGNHAYRLAFPEAQIIAHRATLSALEKEWEAMEDQRRKTFESVQGRDILAAADAIEAEDPERAIGLRMFAGYRAALEPELPTMKLVYPDVVFDERMVFEREGRTIVVQWMGRGNTDGDVLVWLPEDRVLITGDVLVAPIPYAFDSPMVDWIETLGKVAKIEAEIIIPGHGAVQEDTRYLERVVSLLEATVLAVREANAAGVDYGDLVESVDLEEHERLFTRGDPLNNYAWRSFYLDPGLASAWTSLGYPVPDEE